MGWGGCMRVILSQILHLLLEQINLLLLLFKFAFYAAHRSRSSLYNLFHMVMYEYCSLREKSVKAVIVKVFDLPDLSFIKP